MKIVLIQAKYFNIWEALGCGYIGAVAKQHLSPSDTITFYQGYFDDDETIIAGCKDADIIGFSCTSPAFSHALKLSGEIKKINPGCYCVFGGWHPSAIPEIINYDSVDCVITGEGDYAFSEVIQGRRDAIIRAQPVANLDILPFPDRKLIKNQRTIDLAEKMTGIRMTSFQSIRGCPRNCAFCGEHMVSGKYTGKNSLRVRSPERLMEEINQVHENYDLQYFKFVDATWNIDETKVVDFCREKLRTGNNLKWECNLHAALVTENMLIAMKEAGCQQINIGCESGSPKILKDMKKGFTLQQLERVFDWARKLKLERRGYFLLGMPNETVDDIKMTEQLIERLAPDVVGVTIMCPYPGSAIYQEYMSDKNIDWTNTDEYSNDFWETKFLTNKELKYWQNYLIDKFKNNAAWHNKIIKST